MFRQHNQYRNIIAALILILFCPLTLAGEDNDALGIAKNHSYKEYHAGKILTAIALFEDALVKHVKTADKKDYREALYDLLEMCSRTANYVCVDKHLKEYLDLPDDPAASQDAIILKKNTNLLFIGYQALFDNYQETLEILIKDKLLDRYRQPAFVVPNVYVEKQLLMATMYAIRNEQSKASIAIDKALSEIMSLRDPNSYDLASWLTRICLILSESGDIARASSIIIAAENFISSHLPKTGFEYVQYLMTETVILSYHGYSVAAKDVGEQALAAIKNLELTEWYRSALVDDVLLNLAINCIDLQNLECADHAINQHSMAENLDKLVSNNRFISPQALTYAAAYTLVKKLENKEVPEIWLTAFESDIPSNLNSKHTQRLLSYRHTALGLMLSSKDKSRSFQEFVIAGKITIDLLDEYLRASEDIFPLISRLDRTLLTFPILALASGDHLDSDQLDIAFRLFDVYNRNLHDADSDALTRLATASDEERRYIHARMRLSSRQLAIESRRLREVLDAVSQGKKPPAINTTLPVLDTNLRRYFADFTIRKQEIGTALSQLKHDANTKLHVPHLNEMQSLLGPDEVFISVLGTAGRLFHICVRQGDASLFSTELNFEQYKQLQLDTKLLQNAFTASYPPSEELDSQFPAESAVRMYEKLIRPVESCIHEGDHIIWAPDQYLSTIPVGVLLQSTPTKKGTGYDLKNAEWLAKHFSFSYVSSSRGFIAARRMSNMRGSTRQNFLGIGDPVLSRVKLEKQRRNITPPKQGGVMPVSDAIKGLAELPDTSIELAEISRLFRDQARVLTRNNATETQFRKEFLGDYAFISFATHGLIKGEISGLNEAALVLTPTGRSNPSDDGLLRASEIADLNLNASLIVLSACNTANFDLQGFSSDVRGLTTAFAIAGVPTTLVTLWPVESTVSRFMAGELFHEILSSRQVGAADALKRTTNAFLKSTPNPAFYHPRFWAGFIVVGDGGLPLIPKTQKQRNNHRLIKNVVWDTKGGGEVLRLLADDKNTHMYIHGMGEKVNDRYQSFLAQLSASGERRWTLWDPKIGASGSIIALADSIISIGYFSGPGPNFPLTPVVRKITTGGKEVWRKLINVGEHEGIPFGTVRLSDNSIVIGINTKTRGDNERERVVVLIMMDQNGEEVKRVSIPLDKGYAWPIVTSLSYAGGHLIVATTDLVQPGLNPVLDEFDEIRACPVPSSTKVFFLDPVSLKLTESEQLENLQIERVIDVKGEMIGIGRSQKSCSFSTGGAVFKMKSAGKVTIIYSDKSPFSSYFRGISARSNGTLLIAGSSERVFDVPDPKYALTPEEIIKYSSRDMNTQSVDPDKVSDGYVIELDAAGKVLSHTWMQTGARVWINDISIFNNGIYAAGSVGGEAMWAVYE